MREREKIIPHILVQAENKEQRTNLMMQIRLDGFCLPDVMICMFSAPIPSHFSISPAHVCRSEEGQMTSSGHSDEKYMATANA